ALAASVAAVQAGKLALSEQSTTLTTADYELWRHVRSLVPPDGLVFTSMTGKAVDGRQGWNNYPSIGGRQIYLAGWYDGRLTSQPRELDRRLLLNSRVLRGELQPAQLPLARRFGSFYAALPNGEVAPPTFQRVYANESLTLYRISS
ncbi:MAG: hypothetical protein M3540_09450, partial [Actinomycetota bacterium]|nr:hypothetical protein [Actinomycetota bacterium]